MHRIYYLLVSLAFATSLGTDAQNPGKDVSDADAVARLLGRSAVSRHNDAPVGLKSIPGERRAASTAITTNSRRRADGGETNNLTISGSLLYRYSWTASGKPQYGIYSFNAADPSSATPLVLGNDYFAIGGGCYHDGVYSLVTYYDTMGALIASYHEYDTETWEETRFFNNVGVGSIAVDMTYDPVSHNIFGCFINDSRDGYVFGTLDPRSGQREAISNLQGPLFAMASTSQGQLYAVDYYGRLVRVDKNTGAPTVVGQTGLQPYNTQSAAIDPMTDRFYWAACTQSTQGLYEVDLQTGKAQLVAPFTDGEEWAGLYVAPPAAADGAPAAIDAFAVNYDPTTTASALVSFTLPTQTFGGEPLEGSLSYVVTLNGDEVEMGEGLAGESVSLTVYNNLVGEATIGVRCSNAQGLSPRVRRSLYLGHDAPSAVGDLTLTSLSDFDATSGLTTWNNTINWSTPATSVHGGYCNMDEVTYRVIRQPEGRVVANRLKTTSFTDNVSPLVLSAFSYDVIPFAGQLQGPTATTEKVLVGDAFEVPYIENFESDADFNLFTIVDANGDGSAWVRQTDGTAQSYYSMTHEMDDWLISPPIHLTTAQLYRFAMDAKVMNGFPERLEVWIGRGRTPQDMSITLLPAATYSNAAYETFTARFGVPEDGDWYVGFHCISPAEGYRMNIDYFSLDADLLTAAPAAPTNMSVMAGEKGALEAKVSLTAPTTAIDGTPLDGIRQVKVYRGRKLIKTFSNPAPGEVLTFSEADLPNGMVTYTAEALNDFGPGLEATAEVYIGIDVPALPTGVHVIMDDDVPTISWTAPTTGAHGGYIDPATLTYYVQRGTDDLLIASQLTTLTTTDRYFSMPAEQEEIFYYVYAATKTGLGDGQASNIIVVGPPYALPFHESFAGGYLEHRLWGIVDTPDTGTWGMVNVGTMPMCEASDGDNGLLEFQAEGPNDESFLYSGKIDITDATAPMLTFDFYYYPQQTDVLQIMVTTDGDNWTTADIIDYFELHGEAGWRSASIDLTPALQTLPVTGYAQIGFRAISMDGIWRLHVDNITLYADASQASVVSVPVAPSANRYYDLSGRRMQPQHSAITISTDGQKKYIK